MTEKHLSSCQDTACNAKRPTTSLLITSRLNRKKNNEYFPVPTRSVSCFVHTRCKPPAWNVSHHELITNFRRPNK